MTRTYLATSLAGLVGLAGLTGCVGTGGGIVGGGVIGQVKPGEKTKPGIGRYYGKVTFTNANRSTWWSVPSGKTGCTITDTTHDNLGYACKVEGVDSVTLQNWFAVNTVSFPVVAGRKYQFTTYITNTLPPPKTNDVLGLNIVWTP